jgi:hypothetical protein
VTPCVCCCAQELYKHYLGGPGEHRAHELLHTTYTNRVAATQPAYTPGQRQAAPLPEEVAAAKAATSIIPGPDGR